MSSDGKEKAGGNSDRPRDEGRRGDESVVKLPRWAFGVIVSGASLVCGAGLSWAVNIDTTQRCLLQDVSALKADTAHFGQQLRRIEEKVDQLQEMDAKLDQLLKKELITDG